MRHHPPLNAVIVENPSTKLNIPPGAKSEGTVVRKHAGSQKHLSIRPNYTQQQDSEFKVFLNPCKLEVLIEAPVARVL